MGKQSSAEPGVRVGRCACRRIAPQLCVRCLLPCPPVTPQLDRFLYQRICATVMRGQRSSGEQIGVQVVAQIAQPLNLSCCRVFALCFRSARVEQFCNQFVMRSCLLALLLWPWFYRRVGFVLFFHRHLQKSALAIRHLTFHSTRTGRKAGQPVNSSVGHRQITSSAAVSSLLCPSSSSTLSYVA